MSQSDSFESSEEEELTLNENLEKMDGVVAFRKTRKAMLSVGISLSVQCEIFKILSAILHLEQVRKEFFLFNSNDVK